MTSVTQEPTQAQAVGVRRSGRIPKELPIILSGSDAGGVQFSEKTRTLLLSRHGASLISHHKLIPEQEAYLRVVANNREIEVRICGEIGEREDGHIYGVAFTDPNVDFWKIEFPPAQALPKGISATTLECSGCHRQVTMQFDPTEMEVYVVNEGALRYCAQCGVSTIWKISTPRPEPVANQATIPAAGATPSPAISTIMQGAKATGPEVIGSEPGFMLGLEPSAAPASPPAAAAPAVQPNRRTERRTKVKYSACIRVSGWAEEVVSCEDMSRGGFSFHSSREYAEEAMLEAAVPYTVGGISIFVPAQIANMRKLQNGQLFRYGVAYIRSPKR
jgi:hypothetical protein